MDRNSIKLLTVEQLFSESIAHNLRPFIRCHSQGRINVGDWMAISSKKSQDGRMRTVNQILFTDENDYLDFSKREGCITCLANVKNVESERGQERITFGTVLKLRNPIPVSGSPFIKELDLTTFELVLKEV